MTPCAPRASKRVLRFSLPAALISAVLLFVPSLHAQKEELQRRVADLKESMAKNKQALAQYTWLETDTVKLKGEVKKVSKYQVRMGPDGKPQKTPLDVPASSEPQASSGRREGRLKERVVEKKKEEFKEYGDDLKELAAKYLPLDKDAIQAAHAKGNISLTPGDGTQVKLSIKDYVKPGDSVSLLLDKAQKQLLSVSVASYLDDPNDAMTISVQFNKLPDGTNYNSATTLDGVSKQLVVSIQNTSYHKP